LSEYSALEIHWVIPCETILVLSESYCVFRSYRLEEIEALFALSPEVCSSMLRKNQLSGDWPDGGGMKQCHHE
jgi:hypothetical protein